MTRTNAAPAGAIDLLVFLAELVLLAALAVAGARLGSGAVSPVLAVLLPLAAAVLWGLYLAPRASRRLRFPARLVLKLALALGAAGLLAASGAVLWPAAFLVAVGGLFTIGELRERGAS